MNETDPFADTGQHLSDENPSREAPKMPKAIGRYVVERILGRGGFGVVYLARDASLNRLVAIKVPHADLYLESETAPDEMAEAQIVAGLDHAHIVPVYDVGSTEAFSCYFVSKFIDGVTLAERIRESPLSIIDSAGVVATIAHALHYAHTKGLVHRDVKPGNILIDKNGRPFLSDFGLALRDTDAVPGRTVYAGTAAYMSPEQVRGEGHRVDGRSDVFSLGAVLYELLVGRRPFQGESQREILDQVVNLDPRPPRQLDDSIPRELERVCLTALAKRASDRYTTAKDMAEDLDCFRAGYTVEIEQASVDTSFSISSSSNSRQIDHSAAPPVASSPSWDSLPIRVVPKGLRSFDHHDADFFLELLPGARDREGLPDSIRFWKTRIEETDADLTFPVGLLYGPSGCGKSSLVKAGLLPRLSTDVLHLYMEATADDTEARLLARIRKHCPLLPTDVGLKDAMAAIRRGKILGDGKKLLIVLDQFEQWLHAGESQRQAELIDALRQCDGSRLQAVIMVRDDFWMAASRFMRAIEVPLVEGHNSAAVDLFQIRHSQKVLAAFGRAFGDISPEGDTHKAEQQFIEQAVAELAIDGKVIPVQLSLFAEMIKGKPWRMATLKSVGGVSGVGAAFLEETFRSNTAPPTHRVHERAAREVLDSLLPEAGTDIKGHVKSHSELLTRSGYANRPEDFEDLLSVLDTDVRLITPTDPAGPAMEQETSATAETLYYQLTHDYLVPSLREWLTRKQRETRRGRSELRLAEISALWNIRPQRKLLPSWWEWFSITLLTDKRRWSEPQRKMMRVATWSTLTSAGLMILLVLAIGWAAREARGRFASAASVERLKTAAIDNVPSILNELDGYRRWARSSLRQIAEDDSLSDEQRIRASMALLRDDPFRADYLRDRLLDLEPATLLVVRESLRSSGHAPVEWLWLHLDQEQEKPTRRLKAAVALAAFDPPATGDGTPDPRWQKHAGLITTELIAMSTRRPSDYAPLKNGLSPVKDYLIEPLKLAFMNVNPDRRKMATGLLIDYFVNRPQIIIDLLLDGDQEQFSILFPLVEASPSQALNACQRELSKTMTALPTEAEKERLAKRQANAAVTAMRLNSADSAWPLFRKTEDPRARSYLIHRLQPLRVPVTLLTQRLAVEPDTSARNSLLLSLGEYQLDFIGTAQQQQAILAEVQKVFSSAAESGTRAAAEWLLRTWGQDQTVEDWMRKPTLQSADRQWYRTGNGHTMIVIDGRSNAAIGRRFVLSDKEVSAAQFDQLWHRPWLTESLASSLECPAQVVNWFAAIAYCQWLNEKEGIPEDQWCYPKFDYRKPVLPRFEADLSRTGYRLPTTAEWNYANAGGSTTRYHFGHSHDLLRHYAWVWINAENRSQPVGRLKPNSFGLFDTIGNVAEWHADLVLEDRVSIGGGAYGSDPRHVPIGSGGALPNTKYNSYGFRIARTLVDAK